MTPDELDPVLRAFFQAEAPRPWPRMAIPVEVTPARRGFAPGTRSRLTLAASVGLMLAGGLYLAQAVPTRNPIPGQPGDSGVFGKSSAESPFTPGTPRKTAPR